MKHSISLYSLILPNHQARFALSPDTEFTPIGATTQIDYGNAYNGYLEAATRLSNSKFGKSTLKLWNDTVFKNIKKPRKNEDDLMDPDGFQNLMDDMDREEHDETESDLNDEGRVASDEDNDPEVQSRQGKDPERQLGASS